MTYLVGNGLYADGVHMGCYEMTSRRYVSDGFCTSVRPVTERVCAGYCLPAAALPWYAEYVDVWASSKLINWRCVEQRRRRTRFVTLRCDGGQTRRYELRVVSGCRCQRVGRGRSSSTSHDRPTSSRRRAKHRRRRRRPSESSTDWTEAK